MDYWTIVEQVYNTTLTLSFFILMGLLFYLGKKGCKAKNHYGGISTIICGVCFFIFGYYNSIVGFFLFPYNGYMIWWIGINIFLNFIFFMIIRREKKKINSDYGTVSQSTSSGGKGPILRRYVEKMTQEDPYKEEISFKMEIGRKSFHLLGIFLILIYYFLAQMVSDSIFISVNQIKAGYEFLWGDITDFPYTLGDPRGIMCITMMGIIGGLMLAIISDLVRVIWGPEYSFFNFLTRAMLRNKEKNALGPQIYMITGFAFSFMLYITNLIHIQAVLAGVLISCLADAAAALIGRKYGKHKIKVRSSNKKSIEGFLAGTILAYLMGLIFLGPIYALFGALIFFITDYFPVYTADNILNPIFIPIGIQLFILLLGLPVGWG
ncbi:MAG: phosphatidate cytidylyltransferase [Candidatus Thorarchaeota archaeon]